MFRRIIFYDLASGEVVHNCLMQGALLPRTVEQEAAYFGLENYGAFFWVEPDPVIEAAFAPEDAAGKARLVTVTVDVSGAEPRLVVAYEPMPEPGTNEAADMAAALALLGVVPEEG